MKVEVAADIWAIFNAPNLLDAEALLKKTVQKYNRLAAKMAVWMENNLSQALTIFTFPASQRRLFRTTNGLDRLNWEIRRRSRVIALFPNEASCLRLVTAIVGEINEE